MNINYKKGSLLDVKSGVIVHGCNTHGVMGSGVAKQIKEKYPECYQVYKDRFYSDGLNLGENVIFRPTDDLFIVNAITQKHYGKTGEKFVSYDALDTCFKNLVLVMDSWDYPKMDIHIPQIGAGLGGGNWEIIEKIIEEATPNHNVYCWIL